MCRWNDSLWRNKRLMRKREGDNCGRGTLRKWMRMGWRELALRYQEHLLSCKGGKEEYLEHMQVVW